MAAPLTGAAREQAWAEVANRIRMARKRGHKAIFWSVVSHEVRAAAGARTAAHHANRALDLIEQLREDN